MVSEAKVTLCAHLHVISQNPLLQWKCCMLGDNGEKRGCSTCLRHAHEHTAYCIFAFLWRVLVTFFISP
ncbi:hypothetical protein FKM82_019230 [Ascaphus truei]